MLSRWLLDEEDTDSARGNLRGLYKERILLRITVSGLGFREGLRLGFEGAASCRSGFQLLSLAGYLEGFKL